MDLLAQALEMRVEDPGPAALSATGRSNIDVHCVVFGESEIVTPLNAWAEPTDMMAGVSYAIGVNVATVAKRLKVEKDIVVLQVESLNVIVQQKSEKN